MKNHFRMRNRHPPTADSALVRLRAGVSMIELVVSAVLLMTIMTFATSLCCRVNRVWTEIGHHRVAMGELSNQLDALTRMSPDQATTAIPSLQASNHCARTLDQPEMTGELIEDELGVRITLRIDWKRRFPSQPLELSGWLTSGTFQSTSSSAPEVDE